MIQTTDAQHVIRCRRVVRLEVGVSHGCVINKTVSHEICCEFPRIRRNTDWKYGPFVAVDLMGVPAFFHAKKIKTDPLEDSKTGKQV